MKKRLWQAGIFILISILLCSCQDGLKKTYDGHTTASNQGYGSKTIGDFESLVNNTDSYDQLITHKIDIHGFVQTYCQENIYGDGTINDIAGDIGIECLRKNGKGTLYSVHKVKQGGLLYIFYTSYATPDILRWFYVRENLSVQDFSGLTERESKIAQVRKIDSTVQIFENLYLADPAAFQKGAYTGSDSQSVQGMFLSWHYLQDEILEIGYHIENDELIYSIQQLTSDFELFDMAAGNSSSYHAEIYDMDRLQ